MAEFIARARGASMTDATRQGTKGDGADAIVQSWHGSVRVRGSVVPDRQKPAAPTEPKDIEVTIAVSPGTTEWPTRVIFLGRMIDLLALANHGGKLEIPPEGRRMTHEQFEEEYESTVTFVCQCGAEIVMGTCAGDHPDSENYMHYGFRNRR